MEAYALLRELAGLAYVLRNEMEEEFEDQLQKVRTAVGAIPDHESRRDPTSDNPCWHSMSRTQAQGVSPKPAAVSDSTAPTAAHGSSNAPATRNA